MDLASGTAERKNETLMFCHSTPDFGILFLHVAVIIETIVGLPVNMVALWIFCFRMKFWKPHTVFLFNLLLADFLLLISLPFRIGTKLRGENWAFGQIWCNINLFMLYVSRSASIAFMTAVALDRYFKVVHPHHCISRITLTQSGWLVGLIWTVVIALRIPLVTTNLLYQDGNASWCRSFNSYKETPLAIKVHYVVFTEEFFLPWFLLLFCSARIACYLHKRRMARQKRVRRSIQLVGMITLVFTICFMPSILTGLGEEYIKYFHPKNCTSYNLIAQLFIISISFTYLNSALDPFIYYFSSTVFHDALMSVVSHLGFVKKNVRAANNKPIQMCNIYAQTVKYEHE